MNTLIRLTTLEKLEISVMAHSGKFTTREIAEWIGCCYSTVKKYRDYKIEKEGVFGNENYRPETLARRQMEKALKKY